MAVMFVGSFIIQYLLMSAIMVNQSKYVTNSIGKVYISILMALFMIVLEIMMHDHQYHVFSTNMYIILALFIIFFIYLYRKQKFINDKQYLEGMIEHHSMALLTSKQILEKTNSYEVSKLAKDIIQTQEDEIYKMKEIINDIDNGKVQSIE
jgi:Ca2+/Na+ antiporter